MTLKEKKTGEIQTTIKNKEISKENMEKAQKQIEKFLKEFIKNVGKEIDYQTFSIASVLVFPSKIFVVSIFFIPF